MYESCCIIWRNSHTHIRPHVCNSVFKVLVSISSLIKTNLLIQKADKFILSREQCQQCANILRGVRSINILIKITRILPMLWQSITHTGSHLSFYVFIFFICYVLCRLRHTKKIEQTIKLIYWLYSVQKNDGGERIIDETLKLRKYLLKLSNGRS